MPPAAAYFDGRHYFDYCQRDTRADGDAATPLRLLDKNRHMPLLRHYRFDAADAAAAYRCLLDVATCRLIFAAFASIRRHAIFAAA